MDYDYEPVPGMKVRCLRSVTKKGYGRVSQDKMPVGRAQSPKYPEQGGVYTVRNVNQIHDDLIILLFEEVDNSHLTNFIRNGLEPGFDAKHFEPVEGWA